MSAAAPGFGSGAESPPSAQDFDALVTALHAQAKSLDRLAGSVAALAAAVAELLDDEDEDQPTVTYLDGSRA